MEHYYVNNEYRPELVKWHNIIMPDQIAALLGTANEITPANDQEKAYYSRMEWHPYQINKNAWEE